MAQQGVSVGRIDVTTAAAILTALGAVYLHIDSRFDKIDAKIDAKFDALTAELRGLRDSVSTTVGATGVLATDVGILLQGKVQEQQQKAQQQRQEPAPATGGA